MAALALLLTVTGACSQVTLSGTAGVAGAYVGTSAGGAVRLELRSDEVYTWGWGEVGGRTFAVAMLGPWRGPAIVASAGGDLGTGSLDFSGAGIALELPGAPSAFELERTGDASGSAGGAWTGRWSGRGGSIDLRLDHAPRGIAGRGHVGDQPVVLACPAPIAGRTRCSLLFPDGGSLRLGAEERGRTLILTGFGAPLELRRRAR